MILKIVLLWKEKGRWMAKDAFLVLEDGSVYYGERFGFDKKTSGEVVFNTSMMGYQEILTDPSYAGQMVTFTYPLIGNYGLSTEDIESGQVQVSSIIVREWCEFPSHEKSIMTLDAYLRDAEIVGLAGVDTRALTRHLRHTGVMMGMVSFDESPEVARSRLSEFPRYDATNFVSKVSTPTYYSWEDSEENTGPHIVVLDGGLKFNILRILKKWNCRVTVVPSDISDSEIVSLKPDGLVLSPGPGDPNLLSQLEITIKGIIGKFPILGICLGHQMIARAMGAKTYKLKFGHRGANHAVKELQSGNVHITAQNHGYAVEGDSLPADLEFSHVNLNDGTVEGLRHKSLPILSVQYHSEGSPGPRDNEYIFNEFLDLIPNFSVAEALGSMKE